MSGTASGLSSIAMGGTALGSNSTSIGNSTIASGTNSTALGYATRASADVSIAMGDQTIASGISSTAMGINTKSKSFGGTVVGLYNDSTTVGSTTAINNANRIFQIGNGTADNTRSNAVTVLQNGNVGIGITNPVTKLDIAGGNNWDLSSSEGDFRIGNSSYRIKMGIALDGGGAGAATIRSAGGIERLNLGANNTNLLTLNGALGNVGIGTETPSQKLHVIGNILATGTITPSDIRYKINIQPLKGALSNLLQLNGVTYYLNSQEFPEWKFEDNLQYGLIAQEVEKVYPGIVKNIDQNGYKGVDYVKLIPVLIESIKEQQKQIDEQRKMIEQLLKK